MLTSLRSQFSESSRALRDVIANRDLRRLQLAAIGSFTGQSGYAAVALPVWAYEAGGPGLVGATAAARMAPAVVAAPFCGTIADRFDRRTVMIVSDLSRVAVMAGLAAVVMLDGAIALVLLLAAVTVVLNTAFEPAHRAILPSLARTPDELTAANVASSTIDSVTMFVGPALAGVLLAVSDVDVIFVVTAAAFLWSAVMLLGVRPRDSEPSEDAVEGPPAAFLHQVADGMRAVAKARDVRLLVFLLTMQTFVFGLLTVLVVITALEYLEVGESGVGYLTAALGIGGLLGAVGSAGLVGRRRLAGGVAVGLLLWGAPIAFIAAVAEPAVAVVLLAIVGLGNTVSDVSVFTLLQRVAPEDVLGRVFGVLESLVLTSIIVGSLLAPVLVDGFGIRGALIATGVVLPVTVLASWRSLRRIEPPAPPARQLGLLKSLPIFSVLDPPTLEQLAFRLRHLTVPSGATLFHQGEAGDRFYVVAAGRVQVVIDGAPVRVLGTGSYFGEIALLRDVPRTATVVATEDTELFALERDDFLGAVTGHPLSARTTDALISVRLAGRRPGVNPA